jgi:hypothetical protein
LLGAHVIELREAIEHALLGLPIQQLEAGLILQGALLVRGREVLVLLHPLLQMALTGSRPDPGARCIGTAWPEHGGWRAMLASEATRPHRRNGEQQNNCRAETEPGWALRSHDAGGVLVRTAGKNGPLHSPFYVWPERRT